MREHDEAPGFVPGEPAAIPLDRREQDGTAGAGDMLGGPSVGAGGRLGPDAPEIEPTPMPRNQHSFADVEPATDAAENYHGREDPA